MNGLTSKTQRSHRRISRRPSLVGSAAALAAAALFASVVTGCGSESKTAETTTTGASGTAATTTATGEQQTPDAAALVQESSRTTETLQSVHLVLTATNMSQLPVSSVNADVTNQPQGTGRAVGDAKFRAQPSDPFVETQFLVTDKTFYTKDADGTWVARGPADKIYDPGIILDKDMGLAKVIKSVQNPKVDGRETIDGVKTVKVSGTIDAAIIDPVVPTLGQGGGTLPITLYIYDVAPPATGTTTTAIASDAPSPGTGPNLVRFVVNKDQGNVEVTFTNFAKPVDIPSPTG